MSGRFDFVVLVIVGGVVFWLTLAVWVGPKAPAPGAGAYAPPVMVSSATAGAASALPSASAIVAEESAEASPAPVRERLNEPAPRASGRRRGGPFFAPPEPAPSVPARRRARGDVVDPWGKP
jgi:hypothetical protein